MKKSLLVLVLAAFPAAPRAQGPALDQLAGAVPGAAAAAVPPPAGAALAANPGNSLAGKWTGWGEWTYQGSGTRCTMMTLTFEEGADYLYRKGGYFDCGMVALASEPARWAKKDGLLYDEAGAEAGSYGGGAFVLKEAYSESVGIKTSIKVDGLHFDYSEIWTEKDGKELYVITGRLFTGG